MRRTTDYTDYPALVPPATQYQNEEKKEPQITQRWLRPQPKPPARP
jgi:hypothetical protein